MRTSLDSWLVFVLEQLLADEATEIRLAVENDSLHASALVAGTWHATLPATGALLRSQSRVPGDLHVGVLRFFEDRGCPFELRDDPGRGATLRRLSWKAEGTAVRVFVIPDEHIHPVGAGCNPCV
jgi:hypothetical protein